LRHTQSRKQTQSLQRRLQKLVLLFWIFPGLFAISTRASELKPETITAFDGYIAATEARMADDLRLNQFLVIDRLPDLQRKQAYDQLQRGQAYIEELQTTQDHHPIHIPNGMIHHWAGVNFIPNVTLRETTAVLQDYENEPSIYNPEIRRSKLIERRGNESKIYLQFYNKSIITVVLDAYFDVIETPLGSTQLQSASRSTRIVEVVNPGSPNEHERTDGNDHGYMWRLYSYWRIEEKDGGVYMQNESITLTRTVPVLLAWLVNPLTKSIPREVLLDMLTDTKKAVRKEKATSKQRGPSQGGAALGESAQRIAIPHL
jgi:hypothetical protein